jgi:hypothetical protein
MASSQTGEHGVRMRRDLNVWEAIGISVALMAPSFALNANPQGMVGAVGRSIPLARTKGSVPARRCLPATDVTPGCRCR